MFGLGNCTQQQPFLTCGSSNTILKPQQHSCRDMPNSYWLITFLFVLQSGWFALCVHCNHNDSLMVAMVESLMVAMVDSLMVAMVVQSMSGRLPTYKVLQPQTSVNKLAPAAGVRAPCMFWPFFHIAQQIGWTLGDKLQWRTPSQISEAGAARWCLTWSKSISTLWYSGFWLFETETTSNLSDVVLSGNGNIVRWLLL